MMNNLPRNLDCLLEENWVEAFINKNSQQIFGESKEIKLLKIGRSKSFAPESFAMYYEISVNGEVINLRASASITQNRSLPFAAMQYVYDHGFDQGDFRVSKPLAFFEDLNLMFYTDVSGSMFRVLFSQRNDLERESLNIGKMLQKLHSISKLEIVDKTHIWNFDNKKILRYAPELSDAIVDRQNNSLEKIKTDETYFCHGDFQPENIIIGSKTFMIDFGSVVSENKELDVACFVTQLDIMLKRYGDYTQFENLKKSFFLGYGEYDQELYEAYYSLYELEILQALIAIFEEDPNEDKNKIMEAINYWRTKMKEHYGRDS